MRYRTIERLARDILSSAGDTSNDGLTRMLYVLKPIIDDFNKFNSPNIVSELFEIDESLCITLPEKVIFPIKIGKIVNDTVMPFGVNKNIRIRSNIPLSDYAVVTNTGECACNVIGSNPPPTTPDSSIEGVPDSYIFHNYYQYGDYRGEVYGRREPQFKGGTYRYNEKERRIEFGTGLFINVGEEVLIEYKSDESLDRYRLIPVDAYDMIRHRALQRYSEADGNINMARYHRREYKVCFEIYENSHDTITPIDVVGALVHGYATIK